MQEDKLAEWKYSSLLGNSFILRVVSSFWRDWNHQGIEQMNQILISTYPHQSEQQEQAVLLRAAVSAFKKEGRRQVSVAGKEIEQHAELPFYYFQCPRSPLYSLHGLGRLSMNGR